MYNNLNNENVIQYLTDVTYYSTPTVIKTYIILSLLGYDILNKKTLLCCLALIIKENVETFVSNLDYLKKIFKLHPTYIKCDFNKALIKVILIVFKEITLIPCYFHFINNCYKRLKELKSKNDILKIVQKI